MSPVLVGDVGFVSLKAIKIQKKATVSKDSTVVIVRADDLPPIIVCPGWLTNEDGPWSTANVSTVKGEKVCFHKVAEEALRPTATDLDGTPIENRK